MSLSKQVNAERILAISHEKSQKHGRTNPHTLIQREGGETHEAHYNTARLPKFKIPHSGRCLLFSFLGTSTEPEADDSSTPTTGTSADEAYELIHDELTLDGNPLLNLASFVHTHMDPKADQ